MYRTGIDHTQADKQKRPKSCGLFCFYSNYLKHDACRSNDQSQCFCRLCVGAEGGLQTPQGRIAVLLRVLMARMFIRCASLRRDVRCRM